MRALIECALIFPFEPEYVREARADLDLALSIEKDLAAADIIMSHALLMHVIEGTED